MNEAPRWLDASERAAWIGMAAVLTRLPAALDADLKASTGLTHFEYIVLARLSEDPDRTVQLKHLAFLANGSLSRLSHVVARLERLGWLVRRPMREDGRLTVAVLTDSGWDKVVASAPHHVASVREHVLDQLSPTQVRQLRSITRSLLAGMCVEIEDPTT